MNTIIAPDEETLYTIYRAFAQQDTPFTEENFSAFETAIAETKLKYSGQQCKMSVYDYMVEGQKDCLVYNTLYNSLCRFRREEYARLFGHGEFTQEETQNLYALGLLVDASLDEKKLYTKVAAAYARFKRKRLSLVITTTMQCNAQCSYCYEKGVVQRGFNATKVEEMLDFILRHTAEEGVHITWFGGEPLLNTHLIDKVVACLTQHNISYNSYIITNGSLLTEEMIRTKFPAWAVKGVQITLDGTQSNYERIKNYHNKAKDNYHTVLNMIAKVAEQSVHVDLRLNIDRDNLADMKELVRELDQRYAALPAVVMYPAFITGTNTIIPEEERVPVVLGLLRLLQDPQKMGFAPKMHAQARITPCNIADHRSFGIDVEGNLHKCEHYVGKTEYAIGDVTAGVYGVDKRLQPYPLREECQRCQWLPKCYGGCEAHYLEGDIPCMIEKYMIPAYLQYLVDFFDSMAFY